MHWAGHGWPSDPGQGQGGRLPEPSAAWRSLTLGFIALTSLAVTGASEVVLLPVAWAVASIAIAIARRS
jgi:hypothetical protein